MQVTGLANHIKMHREAPVRIRALEKRCERTIVVQRNYKSLASLAPLRARHVGWCGGFGFERRGRAGAGDWTGFNRHRGEAVTALFVSFFGLRLSAVSPTTGSVGGPDGSG